MIELSDVLTVAYWLALLGLVAWWVIGVRRSSKPPARSAREEAELASVRAALARMTSPTGPTFESKSPPDSQPA